MAMSDEANLPKRACHGRGNVFRQIFCSAVASLLQLMQGCVLPLSSIVLPQITTPNDDFMITKEQGSWFASTLCIGFLTGAIVGGFQSDYFGRKKSLMIDGFLAIIGIMIIAFTHSFPLLILARFLCGHASGSGTVAIPIYCSEISHPDIRGVTISFVATFYYFGYCITTLLGTSLPWRIAAAVITIFPISSVFLLCFSPESPVWLIANKRNDEAMKSLMYFRGSESAAEEEKQIIIAGLASQRKENESLGTRSDQIRHVIRRIQSPSFWKPFLIVFVLFTLLNEWSGLPMMAFYLVDIIGEVGISIDPYQFASFLALSRFIFSSVSLGFIYKFRKRPIFFLTLSFMILGNLIVAFYLYFLKQGYLTLWSVDHLEIIKWIPAIGIAMIYLAASCGYAQITYSIQGELFPSDTRAIGGGIIGIIDGISLFLAAKVGPFIVESIQIYGFFFLNSIILLTSFVFSFFFLPETYGLHLEEIESMFLGEDKKLKKEKENMSRSQSSV